MSNLPWEIIATQANIERENVKEAYNKLRDSILKLKNEVDCRIDHGADSNGHLEYVESSLTNILLEFK